MNKPNGRQNQERDRSGEDVDSRRPYSAPEQTQRAKERPGFKMLHRFHISPD